MHLLIELFQDGGIRVVPPAGRPGIATRAEMTKWVNVAAGESWPVRVTGQVNAPLARDVIDGLPAGVAELTVTESSPEPWNGRWTSLMWAADRGLIDQTVDLLDRGSPRRPPRFGLTPYRLAMRRGHVPVMAALRAAGAEDPVLRRPPGAPDAFVMRQYLGPFFWYLAPLGPIIGVVAAVVARSLMAAVVGIIVGLVVVVLGMIAGAAGGWTVLGVDGPDVYYRRLARWRGPVDLGRLAAFGYRGSVHRRSPTLLRLANHQDGEPFRRRTHAGFDEATIARLQSQPDVRVLTVYTGWNFLRPGFERYIAEYIDPQTTLISTNAQPLFRETGHS